jgi:glycine/D-amino acid oxidase-like deaminating enzyme
MRVIICGAGVIGASIAYFLSCRGIKAIVVERTGHSLRRIWESGRLSGARRDGTPLQPLARRSFDLHAQLAKSDRERRGIPKSEHLWRLCDHSAAGRSS